MKRAMFGVLVLAASALVPSVSSAQSLGTFRWQLQPYGSVLTLNVTQQQNGVYTLDGFEGQCGGNASLPASGTAVVQPNGDVMLGVTTITIQGRGLHTRATINTSNYNGFWSDNANNVSQPLLFNPGNTCPGGPRTGPTSPDPAPVGDATAALLAQIAELRAQIAALGAKQQ